MATGKRIAGVPGGKGRAAQPTRGAHAKDVRTFAGIPLTVTGLSREAVGAASLLASSIPKGPLAPTIAAAHAGATFDLGTNESFAQLDIATALANIEAISKSRALRAIARNAESAANSSTPLSIESPRLLAHGRGPRTVVSGMVAGDLARVVAMFARYGYTVNRAFVPSRLDVMSKMSYWQCSDATILGAVPQQRRQTIADAFNRGTTVWASIADIGTDVTGSNTPEPGISY